jgi:hypothetical protein
MFRALQIPLVAYVFIVAAILDLYFFTIPLAMVDIACAGVLIKSVNRVSAASIIAIQIFILVVAYAAKNIGGSTEGLMQLLTYFILIKAGAGIIAFATSRK